MVTGGGLKFTVLTDFLTVLGFEDRDLADVAHVEGVLLVVNDKIVIVVSILVIVRGVEDIICCLEGVEIHTFLLTIVIIVCLISAFSS